MSESLLENSAIVVAHPDDEILWFSSIVAKVDEIVICYLSIESYPEWTEGRKKSKLEYPLANVSFLEMTESEVFDQADWENVKISPHGMDVPANNKYSDNYRTLKEKLRPKLAGRKNVFTHNPWGEYGHEEHVQVYRVLHELREHMHFNLWHTNYCSNKTINFMLQYPSIFLAYCELHPTDKELAEKIKHIYAANGCWTWYPDWKWLDEEVLIKEDSHASADNSYGHAMPINLIRVELSEHVEDDVTWKSELKKMAFRLKRALWKPLKPDCGHDNTIN